MKELLRTADDNAVDTSDERPSRQSARRIKFAPLPASTRNTARPDVGGRSPTIQKELPTMNEGRQPTALPNIQPSNPVSPVHTNEQTNPSATHGVPRARISDCLASLGRPKLRSSSCVNSQNSYNNNRPATGEKFPHSGNHLLTSTNTPAREGIHLSNPIITPHSSSDQHAPLQNCASNVSEYHNSHSTSSSYYYIHSDISDVHYNTTS